MLVINLLLLILVDVPSRFGPVLQLLYLTNLLLQVLDPLDHVHFAERLPLGNLGLNPLLGGDFCGLVGVEQGPTHELLLELLDLAQPLTERLDLLLHLAHLVHSFRRSRRRACSRGRSRAHSAAAEAAGVTAAQWSIGGRQAVAALGLPRPVLLRLQHPVPLDASLILRSGLAHRLGLRRRVGPSSRYASRPIIFALPLVRVL
mmetsp:Transcript_15190/g.49553  ORF Transcript_15190/g.49553 Transcript_15190/m.49553 type:complete len:203 (-) Transcript_15190:99-707(-)